MRFNFYLFFAFFFPIILNAQSPTCNIAQISSTMAGAGFQPLNVSGFDCYLYYYNNTNQSANAAQSTAQSVGTNLVSIESQAENDAIVAALLAAGVPSSAVVWIGGRFTTAAHGPTDFSWYDGSPVTFTNWNSGEPNNSSGGVGNEDCINLQLNNGFWNDLVCDAQPFGLGPTGPSVIKVNLCPEVTPAVDFATICAGNDAQLSASTLFGSPVYTYQWNNLTAGGSAGTGSPLTVSPAVNTQYQVISTDRYGCTGSATITVNVDNCNPSTCNLALINSTMAGAGFLPLNITGFDCYLYYYNNQNQSASAAQNTAQTVGANLVSIESQAENDALVAGLLAAGIPSSAVVWIGGRYNPTNPHGPTDFQWYDGSPVTYTNWNGGEPNNSSGGVGPENCINLQLNNGFWNDLVCNAEPFGFGPTGPSVIKINLCPEVTPVVNNPLICLGDNAQLSSTTLFGSNPYTYSWTNTSNGTNAGTGTPVTVSPATTTEYEVAVTDRYECTGSATITVNVQNCGCTPPSITTQPVGGVICASGTRNISVTAASGPYQWQFNNGGTWVNVSNGVPAGFSYSNTTSATLTVNTLSAVAGNFEFRVLAGDPGCEATSASAFITVDNRTGSFDTIVCFGATFVYNGTTYGAGNFSGTETFTSLVTGCDSLVAVTVTQLPPLTGNFNATLCAGETVVVNGTAYGNGNLNGTEVFTSVLTGCDSTVTVTVTQLPPLTGNFNAALCVGETVVVNGTTYGNGNLNGTEVFTSVLAGCDSTVTVSITQLPSYLSTVNAEFCEGESVTVNGIVYNTEGTFLIPITSSTGCDSSITVNTTVFQNPVAEVSVTNETCDGLNNGSATAIVSSGASPYSYVWNGTPGGSSIQNLIPGSNYILEVTDANGCSASADFDIAPGLNVEVFAGNDTSIFRGESIQLNALTTGGTSGVFEWSPSASLTCSDCANPLATPTNDITYTVVYTDNQGACSASDQIRILVINDTPFCVFPDAFTPNNDGVNDFFKGICEGVVNIEMRIYNRWGELVYEEGGKNFLRGWDGIFKGRAAPAEVYVYYVDIEYENGLPERLVSNLTLIR
jgi:gliding motility-associated-like protein